MKNIFLNRINPFLSVVFEGFLSLIYKENCCICGCSKDNKILCKNCAKDVEILSSFAQGVIRGVKIYSACVYKDTVRTLIHKLKFNHKKAAAVVLAEILHKYYKTVPEFENLQNPLLVPVPTSKRNMKNRGYNNVYEMVKVFSELSNIKILNNFLIKTKDTKPQYKTGKNKRGENISGSFKINLRLVEKYKDKTFIIIDDIITTGSTLDEVIKIFQEKGIKNIICLTLSKTV